MAMGWPTKIECFSGFGSDLAGEAHLNSFRWGPDNRIHLSTNLSGGEVKRLMTSRYAFSARTRSYF